MKKNKIEKFGFYISRLSLICFIGVYIYFEVITRFYIHPESEVSMMTIAVPLYLLMMSFAFFIAVGEAFRFGVFVIIGFPNSKLSLLIHFGLMLSFSIISFPIAINVVKFTILKFTA